MGRTFWTTPFMYTVCPKCALTLVVTAADLRIAQGFVRCGRCSNVFNALARLSEDRNAVGTTPSTDPSPHLQPEWSATATGSRPGVSAEMPAGIEAEIDQDPGVPLRAEDLVDEPLEDSIPETALEFNPAATDVTKLFVEQAPNPEWSAATGKFKALSRDAQSREGQSRGVPPPAAPAQSSDGSEYEIEIDAEFLSTTAQLESTAGPAPAAGAAPATGAKPAPGPTLVAGAKSAMSAAPATGTTPGATRVGATSSFPGVARAGVAASAAATAAASALKRTAAAPSPAAAAPPRPEPRPEPRSTSRPTIPASTARVARQRVGFADPDAFVDDVADAHTDAPDRETSLATQTTTAPVQSRLALLWSAGTGALVILLFAQIVHHYRHDLAANAQLYKPLTSLYSALGIPLVPRWNLGAYDVRQLGASADNETTGRLTVRASVKNTAKQAQPLPLLRVTLQDRFGNRIAARDVPPQSYLPSAIPASSFLSAGQRIDAEMAFVDPGTNAVGFEIDACLPAPGGSIACANDAGLR